MADPARDMVLEAVHFLVEIGKARHPRVSGMDLISFLCRHAAETLDGTVETAGTLTQRHVCLLRTAEKRVESVYSATMGFNRRKMEEQRRDAAEKEAATRRATDAQVFEDAERLIAAWNERQAIGARMIFSPTIGTAIKAGCWFLWLHCPACRRSTRSTCGHLTVSE